MLMAEGVSVEGRAKIAVNPAVFFSKHQVLQRDLSVAVLRALRRTKNKGRLTGLPLNHVSQKPKECGTTNGGGGSPPRVVLRVCDALAGGGVRAIRYALEAGPVEVVANDQSKDAYEAICRNARLSGIENPVQVPSSTPTTMTDNGHGTTTTTTTTVKDNSVDNVPIDRCAIFGGSHIHTVACDCPHTMAASSPSSSSPSSSSSSFIVRLGDANVLLRAACPPRRSGEKAARSEEERAPGRGEEGNNHLKIMCHQPPRIRDLENNTRGAGNCSRRPGELGLPWDFVDIDPFGSCLPFLEAAVGGVADDGILAVAATDLATLCGKKGSKACLSQYGASVADKPYSKEAAIRILLLRMDVLARRRGRRIVPLLCVALDFYVRLFVMIVRGGQHKSRPPPLSSLDAAPTAAAPLMVTQRCDSPEFSTNYGNAGEFSGSTVTQPSLEDASAASAAAAAREDSNDNHGEGSVRGFGVEDDPPMSPYSSSTTMCSGVGTSLERTAKASTSREQKFRWRDGGRGSGGGGGGIGCEKEEDNRARTHRKKNQNTDKTEAFLALGPFWPGPLFHSRFLAAVLEGLTETTSATADSTVVAAAPAAQPADKNIPLLQPLPSADIAQGMASTSELRHPLNAKRATPMPVLGSIGMTETSRVSELLGSEGWGEEDGGAREITAVLPPDSRTTRTVGITSIERSTEGKGETQATQREVRGDDGRASIVAQKAGGGSRPQWAHSNRPWEPPVGVSTRRQLRFLLESLSAELEDCPLFYSLPDVAAAASSSRELGASKTRRKRRAAKHLPTVETVRAELRAAGHPCSGSHIDPRAIKTHAPFCAVEAALQRAKVPQPNETSMLKQTRNEEEGHVLSLSLSKNEPTSATAVTSGTTTTPAMLGSLKAARARIGATTTASAPRNAPVDVIEICAVTPVPPPPLPTITAMGGRPEKKETPTSADRHPRHPSSTPSYREEYGKHDDRHDKDIVSLGVEVAVKGGGGEGGRRRVSATAGQSGARPDSPSRINSPTSAKREKSACSTLRRTEDRGSSATGLVLESESSHWRMRVGNANAGPRVPVGRPTADAAAAAAVDKGVLHLSVTALKDFVEESLFLLRTVANYLPVDDAVDATPISRAVAGAAMDDDDDDGGGGGDSACDGRKKTSTQVAATAVAAVAVGKRQDDVSVFVVRWRGRRATATGSVGSSGSSVGSEGLAEGARSGRDGGGNGSRNRVEGDRKQVDEIEQALGNRFLGRVSFFDTLIDACAAANRDGLAATAGRIVVLLGGIHDAGEGGVCLSGAGSKLVGAVGPDGRLPVVLGRPRTHAIRCTGDGVIIQSISVRGGGAEECSFASTSSASTLTGTTITYDPSISVAGVAASAAPRTKAKEEEPAASVAKAASSTGHVLGRGGVCSREGGVNRGRAMARKRPRLVFDHIAAQAVTAAAAVAASRDGKSSRRTQAGGRSRGVRRDPAGRGNRGAGVDQQRRTGGGGGFSGYGPVVPVHAVSVEAGSTSLLRCEVTSVLPSACVCVSGGASHASLEKTRLFRGYGAGLMVCGKAEASATDCSFEGMGAAGVEARGGSSVSISRCLVSTCGKSGVFVQGFSRALIRQCDITRNGFAGVEAMRNASLKMEACRVDRSRRGGVLIHVGSEASLHNCTVSGSRLAGVDVRTGSEALLEACFIEGSKASGVYTSAGGSVTMLSTRLAGNRLAAVEVKPPPSPPPAQVWTPRPPLQHFAPPPKAAKSHYNKGPYDYNSGMGKGNHDDADAFCCDAAVEGSELARGSGDNHVIGGGGGGGGSGGGRCLMGKGNLMEGNGIDGILEQGESPV